MVVMVGKWLSWWVWVVEVGEWRLQWIEGG